MKSTANDKRTFYLMLSATEGQEFASTMGFQPPSEDVQEMEIMDVVSRWVVLAKAGVFEDVLESGEWFVDFLVENDKLVSPPEQFFNALTVFGIAMLNKLMDKNIIGIVLNDELAKELDDNE